jgi:hypothetical protein
MLTNERGVGQDRKLPKPNAPADAMDDGDLSPKGASRGARHDVSKFVLLSELRE